MCLTYRRGGYILVSIFFIIGLYLIGSICSYYSVNPFSLPPDKIRYPVELIYPSQENGLQFDPILYARFWLESNKTLAAGVNLTITNAEARLSKGFNNKNFVDDILGIELIFQNSQPTREIIVGSGDPFYYYVPNRYNYEGTRVYLDSQSVPQGPYRWVTNHTYLEPIGLSLGKDKINSSLDLFTSFFQLNASFGFNFYFPLAGDYSPGILIMCKNGSLYKYIDNKVNLHVPSELEVQTGTLNQINSLIAIILLILSWIQCLKLIREW